MNATFMFRGESLDVCVPVQLRVGEQVDWSEVDQELLGLPWPAGVYVVQRVTHISPGVPRVTRPGVFYEIEDVRHAGARRFTHE